MNSRAPIRRPESCPAARLFTSAVLVLALLSGVAFVEGVTLGRLCKMDCCAGLPAHVAGSCAHGSCHVDLRASQPPPQEVREAQAEQEAKAAREEQGAQGGHCGEQARQAGRHGETGRHGDAHDAPPPSTERAALKAHPHDPPGDASIREQSRRHESQPATTSVSGGALTRPCPPDCGAGSFNYTNQRRPRDSAAASYADRPRPPSAAFLQHASHDVARALEALCRRSRPRGPPSFSS